MDQEPTASTSKSSGQKTSRKRIISTQSDDETQKKKRPITDENYVSTDNTRPHCSNERIVQTFRKGGLVHTLHGNIYQLKLLMLFLKRALDKRYDFNLGTEVEDAEKFDDIVFKYKERNDTGKYEIRFVQAKHKQDERNKITISDLLQTFHSSKNDFSLQKYFISYCKIKKKYVFSKHKLKDFIIYTNIDFADLGSIKLKILESSDDILQVTKSDKYTKRFQLTVPTNHELYNKLKETSKLHVLVTTLKQVILENKCLHLKNEIFELYHIALCDKVFEIRPKQQKNNNDKEEKKRFAKFRKDFLFSRSLSVEVSNFRNALFTALNSKDPFNDTFLGELSLKEFKISKNFGQISESRSVQNYDNELPSDTIKDEEIKEFFDKLVFAVNQPNEEELGNIIAKEMGKCSKFNLLNASLVSDSLQKIMLDWFKEKRPEKGKEGSWLNAKTGEEYLNTIETKVNSLISIGISVSYPETLARYGITFRENSVFTSIFAFLSQVHLSKKILCVISPHDTFLSAINVYNALEAVKLKKEFTKYKRDDCCIFLKLSTLLAERTQQYVIDAFESIHNHYLLIIDCDLAAITSEQLYLKLYEILLNTTDNQIILISNEQNSPANLFKQDIKSSVRDETNFEDLTEVSKENLMNNVVIFQNQKMKFSNLIDNFNINANKIITTNTMLMLLKCEEINLNSSPQDLGEVTDFYIDRSFRRVVLSKENIKKYLDENNYESDIFIITGTDGELKHPNVFSFDHKTLSESKFIELCDQNREQNIHWLENYFNDLTWHKSHGSINNIAKFIINDKLYINKKNTPLIHENKFIHEVSYLNTVIISNSAGMGKTTVLTNLSKELTKSPNCLWVVRINLNDYTSVLKRLSSKKKIRFIDQEKSKIADFLLNHLLASQIQSTQEKIMFNHIFQNNGKIAFLFDGFDEICPVYKEIVIDLILSLKKCNVETIYITTRPNVKVDLEETMGTFSYVLEPLSKNEQTEFLLKFWTRNLHLDNMDQACLNRLQIYVEYLIQHISKITKDNEEEFIGIPLQTMMMAEVFQENQESKLKQKSRKIIKPVEWQGCKDFLRSKHEKPKLPSFSDFLDLYEHFIRKKFEKFYLENKKGRDLTKTDEPEAAFADYKHFKNKCAFLALPALFEEKNVKKILCKTQYQKLKIIVKVFKKNKFNVGIFDQFINDKPIFVHRTFAEYFASFSIVKQMLLDPAATLQCLNCVVLNLSTIFISSFVKQLDGKQDKITSILQIPLLHFVIIENHLNFVKSLLLANLSDWSKKLDSNGKTPLHYAAEFGHVDVAKIMLDYANDINEKCILRHGNFKKPEYENSKLVQFINISDNEGKTALHYALQKRNVDFAFDLLLKGASIETLSVDEMSILMKKMVSIRDNGILAAYANQENKYRPIQEKLILRAPDIFKHLSEKDQSRILSYFCVHGRVKVIDVLLGTISDLEQRKKIINNFDNDKTPLDRVNKSDELSDDDRLEITKYLLENNGTHSSYNKNYITQILQSAVRNGSIKTFKYFITQEKNENINDHLYDACHHNQFKIVQFLRCYKEINMDGNNALHYACDSNAKLSIIKHLIKNNFDVNARNGFGETPLFRAVLRCNLNVVQYLVSKGADVNTENLEGNTPLACAINSDQYSPISCAEKKDQENIIKYLLRNGAHIISSMASEYTLRSHDFFKNEDTYDLDLNINGYPRLHEAVRADNLKWLQFLLRHGDNVNKVDADGKTPLHWACKYNKHKVVELLLQYGAMFDVKDNNNKVPRDMSFNSSCCKVFWLLNVLDKLFNSYNFMKDLYEELLNDKDGLAYWGPYKSGYVDSCDSDNPMLFILNAKNNQGKTLLHIAATDAQRGVEALKVLLQFDRDYLKRQNQLFTSRCEDYQPASVNTIDCLGNTPIHVAAQHGQYMTVSLLLEEGAMFNHKNALGKTPETLATENEHVNVVTLLQSIKLMFDRIEENNVLELVNLFKEQSQICYINAKNENGKTPLHLAAQIGDLVIVQLLLDNGAQIDPIDLDKNTPLHLAAKNNEIEIVKILFSYGAVYNTKNLQNQIPFEMVQTQSSFLLDLLKQVDLLFRVIQGENPEIIISNLIWMSTNHDIDIKVLINIRDDKHNTLLHYATKISEYKIVEFMLENGASYNILNRHDHSPLEQTNDQNIGALLFAVYDMFENIDDVCETQGVNVKIKTNVRDCERKGLLYYAAVSCSLETVKFLTANGANVNLTDVNYYKTCANASSKLDIIKCLIDNGDVNTKNYKGETPLIIAVNCKCNKDVIRYLVSKGSDLNQKDLFGNTALSCAVESDIVELLVSMGALN